MSTVCHFLRLVAVVILAVTTLSTCSPAVHGASGQWRVLAAARNQPTFFHLPAAGLDRRGDIFVADTGNN